MARQDLGAALAEFRSAVGLTQEQMAELVPGWTRLRVTRIESGERNTLYDIRDLLGWVDAIGMPRQALAPLILGTPDTTWHYSHLEETVDRRTFNASALALAASALAPAAPPERVGAGHLHLLRRSLEHLYARDWTVGGGSVLCDAMRLFAQTRNMIDESDYPEQVGRELLAVGANFGVCGSFVAFDAGDLSLARRLVQEARTLADGAGDPLLSAHVFVTMALQSTTLARQSGRRGPARESLRLLNQAECAVGRQPAPRLYALIQMRRAPAAALVGDTALARQSLAAARRELERADGGGVDPEWFAFVTPTEIDGHEARSLADQGRPAAAAVLYGRAVEDPSLPQRNRAFYRAVEAQMRLRDGDVDAALEVGDDALKALEGPVRSMRSLEALRPVREKAETKRPEFAERFDAAAATMVKEMRGG
ncbi:helix-turn-helix transcriptional regulator [Actinomadura hibisca]|uniref:helix-turn-helix transcriptional regulator n=1 Tax=Actinomadura hibisca TaxID=68565 RepID=UPI000835A43A|nr:helix-turn-helix transcriptional regulator [Actinomadura hibisca]